MNSEKELFYSLDSQEIVEAVEWLVEPEKER
jgi:hypothetical protein